MVEVYLEETSNHRALYCQYNLGYLSSDLPSLASVYWDWRSPGAMVYGWIDRYDDLVNQCRGSPFFCHPDIPLLLLVQTKSGITKKEAAPPNPFSGGIYIGSFFLLIRKAYTAQFPIFWAVNHRYLAEFEPIRQENDLVFEVRRWRLFPVWWPYKSLFLYVLISHKSFTYVSPDVFLGSCKSRIINIL